MRPGVRVENDGDDGSGNMPLRSLNEMKDAARDAVHEVAFGRFQNWTNWELIEVLVAHEISLRHERFIPREFLLQFSEVLFQGVQIPDRPVPPTEAEFAIRNHSALVIQQAWILKNIQRNHDRMLGSSNEVMLPSNGSEHEVSFTSNPSEENEEKREPEAPSHPTMTPKRGGWRPPSWEYAKAYINYIHPRKPGVGGKMGEYEVGSSTGRHCVMGGCGEQLDLWDEGQVSEFGQFGPGITNYFKFIKWCAWTFAFLSVIYLPMLIINTFGIGSEDATDMGHLAFTTIGNLGDAFNVSQVEVPGCVSSESHSSSCLLDKGEVGRFYALLDILGVCLILIGHVWLRGFERREEDFLDHTTVTPSDYTIRVPNIPPNTTEEELFNHFQRVTGVEVVSVALGYNNSSLINAYQERGELIKKKLRVTAEIQFYESYSEKSDIPDWEDEVDRLQEEKFDRFYFFDIFCIFRLSLSKSINKLNDSIKEFSKVRINSALCAYVTFNKEAGMLKSIYLYQNSWVKRMCMKRALLFRGEIKLTATVAPEPSTILWENLQYDLSSRRKRRMVTSLVAASSLIISILVTFMAREFQDNAEREAGGEECPANWGEMDTDEQQDVVKQNSEMTHCYCGDLGIVEKFEDNVCFNLAKSQILSDSLTFFASLIVVLMNDFFVFLMRKMARVEKHHSVETEEGSMFRRIFLLKFVNTGVIILLLNSEILKEFLGIEIVSSDEFSTEWFMTSGVSIILVMTFNILGPHLPPLYRYLKMQEKIENAKEDPFVALTQEELNTLHMGPEFHLSTRYAQILVTFYVCYMYSSGIPLLLMIGCVSFLVMYWVDKWFFIRFYRTPPRLNVFLGREASAMIPWAVILHLFMSIWMLGNEEIFVSNSVTESEEKYDRLILFRILINCVYK